VNISEEVEQRLLLRILAPLYTTMLPQTRKEAETTKETRKPAN
jgi:hypothetical protein